MSLSPCWEKSGNWLSRNCNAGGVWPCSSALPWGRISLFVLLSLPYHHTWGRADLSSSLSGDCPTGVCFAPRLFVSWGWKAVVAFQFSWIWIDGSSFCAHGLVLVWECGSPSQWRRGNRSQSAQYPQPAFPSPGEESCPLTAPGAGWAFHCSFPAGFGAVGLYPHLYFTTARVWRSLRVWVQQREEFWDGRKERGSSKALQWLNSLCYVDEILSH